MEDLMFDGSTVDFPAVPTGSTVEVVLDCEGRELSRWTAEQWTPALACVGYDVDSVPYRVVAYTVPIRQQDGSVVCRLHVQPDRAAHRPHPVRPRRVVRHQRGGKAA
jgi:hypothetical protein